MEIAKWIVAGVALYGFGGFVADALVPSTSRQHLWNPAWPPHAKFHNAQSMLLGMLAGSLSLAILFSFRPLTVPLFFIAWATAAMYWVSILLAPFFPGTAWYDPEFKEQTSFPLGFAPQQLLGYVLCVMLIIAAILAVVDQ